MYERFTDRARNILILANEEAQRFGHEYIGTEHLLLGLIKEGSGVASNVLKNLAVDLRKIRLEIERLVLAGGSEPSLLGDEKLPYTPRVKKVIEFAIDESRRLNHSYVGTEHLLLGLFREPDGTASQVLHNLGLSLDGIRGEVSRLLGDTVPDRFGRESPSRTLDPPQESVTTLLDRHIAWLQRLMERAVTERNLELAAESLAQLGELRTLRDRLDDDQ